MRLASDSLALIPVAHCFITLPSPCAWREHPEAGNMHILTTVNGSTRFDLNDEKQRRDIGPLPLEYAGGTMIVRSIPI